SVHAARQLPRAKCAATQTTRSLTVPAKKPMTNPGFSGCSVLRNGEVPLFKKPCFQGISLSHKVFAIQCESGTSYQQSTETQFVSNKLRRSLCRCKANRVSFLFTVYGPTAHASTN